MKGLKIAMYGVLALSLILITVGIVIGEPGDVASKATFVCMECIGIG
ncbi:MAG: CD1871A family CXXC motif-containing protein [Sphaerochaetaceae bacterium]|jgi:hypothetical protein|nr:CD1871A family CXXC motif-containing protein [Sphaerochaetaceae bacterium]NLY07688.1 hypothetical protein [Spirochaetales bacterium]